MWKMIQLIAGTIAAMSLTLLGSIVDIVELRVDTIFMLAGLVLVFLASIAAFREASFRIDGNDMFRNR